MHAWDATTPIEETMRALDDLVRDGKVRFIGFSDTPGVEVRRRRRRIARFRGWSPLIALQIEYSLLERTVEGELIPMARELGLGVTPWSPLARGVLSRQVHARESRQAQGRTAASASTASLDDKAYASSTSSTRIAKELGTTAARVALAWVASRPGVTSTIIGARTMEQLDDNLGAAAASRSRRPRSRGSTRCRSRRCRSRSR